MGSCAFSLTNLFFLQHLMWCCRNFFVMGYLEKRPGFFSEKRELCFSGFILRDTSRLFLFHA